MNILAKKISLIEWIAQLSDTKLIEKIEEIKMKSTPKSDSALKAMSIEEFMSRYKQSKKDIEEGNLVLHEDAKKYFRMKYGKNKS